MRWLLPVMLVLLVALLLAAAHFLFMRWMTRQPESTPIREAEPEERVGVGGLLADRHGLGIERRVLASCD